MALWNEKPTPPAAPTGRKEPLTPVPTGASPQPVAPAPMERSPAPERGVNEAALAAAPRRPVPRVEGGESVIAANLTIEGKIEGSGNVRMAGRFKGDVRIDGNFKSAKRVDVLEGGVIVGDVKAGSITVAAGSRMRGHVEFGWDEEKAKKLTGS